MATFQCRGREYHINTRSDPGLIEHIFTRGHCHSFALAVHELTGWPIVGLFVDYDSMAWHCVNRTPDGRLFDILGLGVEERWANAANIRELTTADIDRYMRAYWDGNVGYLPCNVEGAKQFAKEVIRRVK
jgi:hypothetical protein